MSVTHLIGRRSGPQIECMPTVDAERLTETLVAFANTDGGHILLGVTPAGHVIGNLQEEEVEGALRHALVNCLHGHVEGAWLGRADPAVGGH